MNNFEIFKSWICGEYLIHIPQKIINILQYENIPSNRIISASIIIHRLSNMPWYTQEQLLSETELSKSELIELNSIIRKSDFLQNMITKEGLGKKYWKTIMPLLNMDFIKNVLENKYNFPLRIGIYPGISCMFYCGFCGRNQKASYPGDIQEDSLQVFKNIFKSMPKSSTISISGGLEPLTHKHIGEIISYAKKCGIRVPLITNFHNGTPKFVERNPGLLELDSCRVSLYGIDEESTYEITRKKGAYKLVKNNIIEFLKKRNEVNPNLNLGLNYIIIPENVHHISKLMDYIIEVNSKVDNGRGIDYITIREDFGSVTDTGGDDVRLEGKEHELDGFLSKKDRIKLMKSFKEFYDKRDKYCPDLNVDFGYALDALSEGVFVNQIKMVGGDEMRKCAYPQVSVAVDSYGDIFLYREAGFLDRPGNEKFIIGRITSEKSFDMIIKEFIENNVELELDVDDSRFMDAFDHLVTVLINQTESDQKIGIPFEMGPVLDRTKVEYDINSNKKTDGLFGTYHQ